MGIVVHHLNNSRSQRVLWLLEELGIDYEIRHYQRDAVTNLAPPELKAVHPLGKSPLLEIDGRVIEESGAIVQVLCERYGNGAWLPEAGSDEAVRHLELMHFAEGSAMTPVLMQIYTSRLGEAAAPLKPRIDEQLASHFGYMEQILRPSGHFIGDDWTGADVMLSFPAEIAVMQGAGVHFPKLAAFVAAVHARPAWQRAREKGGDYFGM
ncbi:MAG: glutathione S-transferase [Novosphingobium sp. 28-62-57]|uniref:glutathione S-transferase family protein n=1 Tax=unclassified Novosphingobium TaxID=2644732 RepID=UPI000BDD8C05|nr:MULTISPECIES: glutathione S-transferase [unclassified Novosphingobium]OYW49328.1 MAG: glutathione S-transferase [Novosphingobium sp. 12-62-10]OYZ09084.1 MAG: glutathione S-transferase [Novosphingobium sp. 28-62-57]HQS70256.1 glutathione S-transferase [Novosphingobium sp.]